MDQQTRQTVEQMIPGLNLVAAGRDQARAAQNRMNSMPTAQSRATQAQQDAQLRIARIRAAIQQAQAAGDQQTVDDLTAFLGHLNGSAPIQPGTPAPAPAARRVPSAYAADKNAFAAMGLR